MNCIKEKEDGGGENGGEGKCRVRRSQDGGGREGGWNNVPFW